MRKIEKIRKKAESVYRDLKMKIIAKDCVSAADNGKTILFAYCFLIYENCRYHDFLLAQSLKNRGCKIVPLICGGLQERECSSYGGYWGNNFENEEEKRVQHKKNCLRCMKCDKQVWKTWSGSDYISAKDEITEDEKETVRSYVDALDIQDYKEWVYEGYNIGWWAWLRYCNDYLISEIFILDSKFEKCLKSIAYNVILMVIATQKVCDKVKPDIIYSNDSVYYPYCIAESIAKERGIPFYNAYGYNKNTYSYAYNTPSMRMELTDTWKTYGKRDLTKREYEFIQNYLQQRRLGETMLINTADPKSVIKDIKADVICGSFDKRKRTALLATNLSWDGASLGREIQFNSMREWVIETAHYFEDHPEWQLVIRSHPAEKADILPLAKEQFTSIVWQHYNGKLPDNIILFPSDADINIYELIKNVAVGLVHTSTIGLEMAATGIPVVTTGRSPYHGKGFTYDTETKEEYFHIVEYLMTYDIDPQKRNNYKNQALKFFYLYYFKYMVPNYWYTYTYQDGIKLKIKSGRELLPGQNQVWDYICDSIIEGKPMFSENRMIPYSVV